MTRANPPPRVCLLLNLIRIEGDDWARDALEERPGLLSYIKQHATSCDECDQILERLFPKGVPHIGEPDDEHSPELRAVLDKLRTSTAEHPIAPPGNDTPGDGNSGTRPRGGDGP